MQKKAVAIIGVGVMGSMILRASSQFSPAQFQLMASNRRPGLLEALAAELPHLHIGTSRDIVAKADIVIICVEPRDYLSVIEDIAGELRIHTILVSITNGVSLEAIAEKTSAPVVKVIPSVTHTVGRGIALITEGPGASRADIEAVQDFFRPFSLPMMVPRVDNRIASNVSGCGPALIACFCNHLAQANIDQARQLDATTVKAMLRESLLGAAALIEAGMEFDDIMRRTATRGGSTEAALDVLNSGLPDLLKQMVEATFATHSA